MSPQLRFHVLGLFFLLGNARLGTIPETIGELRSAISTTPPQHVHLRLLVSKGSACVTEVREEEGDLVVVLSVVGLKDPQHGLQHVLLRPRVNQGAVGISEVREGKATL